MGLGEIKGRWRADRFSTNPLLRADGSHQLGNNVNGPSVIECPAWMSKRLGRFHMYFAHHHGQHIRLAFADDPHGPWQVFPGGVLSIENTGFDDHIASPDVHVDHASRTLRLFFHGRMVDETSQHTKLATSTDGLHFHLRDHRRLGPPYWRAFAHESTHYALAMPGQLFRFDGDFENVEVGPQLFPPTETNVRNGEAFLSGVRHCAVYVDDETLHVWFSNRGDAPERIFHSTVDLTGEWTTWELSQPQELLRPEGDTEGANQPVIASRRGAAMEPVNQLRDPAVLQTDGELYLFYSIAGEQGVSGARLIDTHGENRI